MFSNCTAKIKKNKLVDIIEQNMINIKYMKNMIDILWQSIQCIWIFSLNINDYDSIAKVNNDLYIYINIYIKKMIICFKTLMYKK